jgi:putative flippase GtrA
MFEQPRGHQRRPLSRTAGRLLNFTVIGAVCTILFAVLYDVFRTMATPVEANIAALSVTMPLNFAANRWLTFAGGSRSLWSEALQYGAVYLFGLACSSLVLAAALDVLPAPGATVETLIAIAAGGVATVIRFVLLSLWVFRPAAPRPLSHSTDLKRGG